MELNLHTDDYRKQSVHTIIRPSPTPRSPSLLWQSHLMKPNTHIASQSETFRVSRGLHRPMLSARWEIENNRLVCRWVVSDRLNLER